MRHVQNWPPGNIVCLALNEIPSLEETFLDGSAEGHIDIYRHTFSVYDCQNFNLIKLIEINS